MSSTNQLIMSLISVALVVLSASLHEAGHALAAHLCGDDTAKEQGRLTINPLAHIDPVGSVLLPLMGTLSGFGYIAFAKPVPYNPWRLRNRRRDEVIVAVAGPAANLAQAIVGALIFRILYHLASANAIAITATSSTVVWWTLTILARYVLVNCSLAFFNLIPLPPLDGSKLLMPLLKGEVLKRYYQIQAHALPITLALVWLLPSLTGLDPIGWWLDITAYNLFNVLLGW